MKKYIIAVLTVGLSISAVKADDGSRSEKLAAAKAQQAKLLKEIERLEKNPTFKEVGLDMLKVVKREYAETSAKVAALTKEIVEKIKK